MKRVILLSIWQFAIFLILSCSDSEVIPEPIPERPIDITPSAVRLETLQKIPQLFPETVNAKISHPSFFKSATEKRVILSAASDVYVTFISEGASKKNSFGYYTYNLNSIPSNPATLTLNLLFPNVDETVLNQGDMLRLGDSKFPAGTVIGFFLLIDGWDAQTSTVNFKGGKIYTDLNLNKNSQQGHVLFKLDGFGDLILTFEDVIDGSGSDFDFNDIIFTISDNKDNLEITSFNLNNVVKL